MTHWITEIEEVATAVVREILSRPMPENESLLGCDGEFNPWDIFPVLYGSYCSDFDKCAIDVLCELQDKERRRKDLAADMLREMMCTANLCSYGSSPRVCFTTESFGGLLPDLIEKWKAYATLVWGKGWDLD